MTPEQFIARWKDNPLTERAGAQAHFDDLCDLLGVEKPRDPDHYCFERGAKKAGGGDGWADAWKRHFFGWENKKPGRSLDQAYKQLTDYAADLEHPPLLVVSDRERIVIHTAFTGYPDQPREIRIEDLIDPEPRQLLRWVFTDPDKLRPEKSSAAITAEAARDFADLAAAMRQRGLDGQRVAHFLVQCLFAMFAEDERLLPAALFTGLLDETRHAPDKAAQHIGELFRLMQKKGGHYGTADIAWFNGGLFKSIDIPPLTPGDLAVLHQTARRDWCAIDPTIFGTLFERGLDPTQRIPLGAHYTDPATIDKIIDPLIRAPLLAEWARVRAEIERITARAANETEQAAQMARAARLTAASKAAAEKAITEAKRARTKATNRAVRLHNGFLRRLRDFRVLDPACGSGNFLYLSLKALRDVEKRTLVEAVELGLPEHLGMATGPHNVLGIEINDFAAELARVTVWIGDIQWCRRNGYQHASDPILQPLDGIAQRDALLNPDGSEAEWPAADVVVGNPPFLGGSKKRGALGDDYFARLERVYAGRVPAGADLVCYWFEKARAHIQAGKVQAAGLVATNSIRGGSNRRVLERILSATTFDSKASSHSEKNDDDHRLRHPKVHPASGVRRVHVGIGRGADGGRPRGSERTEIGANGVSGLSTEDGSGGFETRPDQMDDRSPDRTTGDPVTDRSAVALRIFNAWSDEPWINEGAAVRVSLVCFGIHSLLPQGDGPGERVTALLDGQPVGAIYADLTGQALGLDATADLTRANRLAENNDVSFQGTSKKASFDIASTLARQWIPLPNPHGKPNSDVVRPWSNGLALAGRATDLWIIDFGIELSENDAAFYEAPYQYSLENVKPEREKNNRESYRKYWWRHAEPRPGMRRALTGLSRYIATIAHSKHRFFVWLDNIVCPDQALIVFARADDTTFGILHSRFHELWSLRLGTSLEDRPRYTPTTTFETFPFPAGLTPADTNQGTETLDSGAVIPTVAPEYQAHAAAIAEAAHRLNRLRENWLNPPEWTERVPEAVPGYPDRILPRPGHEADLKRRTLTNLYNDRPAWLTNAHRALDAAVAAAYGWTDGPDLTEAEILSRLLALNLERAG